MAFGKKVLILGEDNSLGGELIGQLLDRDYEVVISPRGGLLGKGYSYLQLDLGDLASVEYSFIGVDVGIVLFPSNSWLRSNKKGKSWILMQASLILGNIFQAAARAKVSRLVFISSSIAAKVCIDHPSLRNEMSVCETFPNILGEIYCRTFQEEFGLPFTIIRPSEIYGLPRLPIEKNSIMDWVSEILEQVNRGNSQVKLNGKKSQICSPIHARDLAIAIIVAMESKKAENVDLNIAGVEKIRKGELAEIVCNLCPSNEVISPVFSGYHHRRSKRELIDSAKLMGRLGWEPNVVLREGIEEEVSFLL
jgi:nucleoside-diphosphate-sugar epimerase